MARVQISVHVAKNHPEGLLCGKPCEALRCSKLCQLVCAVNLSQFQSQREAGIARLYLCKRLYSIYVSLAII